MKIVLFLFFLSFHCIHAFASDTALLFSDSGRIRHIAWSRREYLSASGSDEVLRFKEIYAIRSTRGIQITNGAKQDDAYSIEAKTPFIQESWQRFYLYFEAEANSATLQSGYCTPITYSFYPWLEKERPSNTVTFTLAKSDSAQNGFLLKCRLRPSILANQDRQAQVQVFPGVAYCVETHLQFTDSDTLRMEWFLDGLRIWQENISYVFPKEFIAMTLVKACYSSELCRIKVRLDGFSIASHRLFAIPPKPITPCDSIVGDTLILMCKPFTSNYRNEKLAAVRFRLFMNSLPQHPLYDKTSADPNLFQQFRIPFELDSGGYFWQAAFKNQFGQWSTWSNPCSSTINHQRHLSIKLKQFYLSEENKTRPIQALQPERWYDLHLKFDTFPPHSTAWSYCLAWLSHDSYTESNLINKGGPFLSRVNYPINVSFLFSSKDSFGIFEKKTEGSSKTQILEKNRIGLYVDGRTGRTIVDTSNKEVRIRFKLLPQTLPGQWYVSGIIVVPFEQFSNLITFPIEVTTPKRKINALYIFGILILFFMALAIFFFLTRKKQPLPNNTSVLTSANKHLVNYINEHISEKLSVDKIKQDLRINRRIFYEMLSEGGIDSLPQLVNIIKIERAKTLLTTTNKTVSEISNELGFESLKYFGMIFKKYTHLAPTEFRSSLIAERLKSSE